MTQAMKSLYQAGKSLKEIGKDLGIHHETVRRRLTVMGIPMRRAVRRPVVKQVKTRFSVQDTNEMVRLYTQCNKSLVEIAAVFHTSRNPIRNRLVAAGVTMRAAKKRAVKKQSTVMSIKALKEAAEDKVLGLTWSEIAKHYNLPRTTVYMAVKPYVDALLSR